MKTQRRGGMARMSGATGVALAALAALSGCGGGTGDTHPQDPQGFWEGTAEGGRQGWALVRPNGQFFYIFSAENGVAALDTVRVGNNGAPNGDRVISDNGMTVNQSQFWYAGWGSNGGDLHAVTHSALTGFIDGVEWFNFVLRYVDDGMQPSGRALLPGTYVSWPVQAALRTTATTQATMTIDAQGVVQGDYFAGCTYSGQATPTTQPNLYDLVLNFTGACQMAQSTGVQVSLYHDVARHRVVAAGAHTYLVSRGSDTANEFANVFMFVGTAR